MFSGTGDRPGEAACLVAINGDIRRSPGPLRLGLRRLARATKAFFIDAPSRPDPGLRPTPHAETDRIEAYLAETEAIRRAALRVLSRQDGPVAGEDIVTIAPLGGAFSRGPLAARIAASEVLAVVLRPGAGESWRLRRVRSQAIGAIVMAVQACAQALRRDCMAHRVYVLVYETDAEGGRPALVALNFEACRRPADALRESQERARLVHDLRQRFGVTAVAEAALLGGEPSLVLDVGLDTGPRRRFVTGVTPVSRDAA